MAKLDRVMTLVHALADSADGLTLDDMAEALGVNRRTAERMRDVVARHFDLDEVLDDRRKRFRIRGSLRRFITRPGAAEIAALQTEIESRKREGAPQAQLLESLLAKVKSAFDVTEKNRLEPDLDPLTRLQRSSFQPGPLVETHSEVLGVIQEAIMAGHCVEFDYGPDGSNEKKWRRVVPFGLIHGPITYLVGKVPGWEEPVPFRLDRMDNAITSEVSGAPADDWSLDCWMEQSVGIWREEEYDVVLRAPAGSSDRARNWRFHPRQVVEEQGDDLIIRFKAGGLWQIADHVFSWGGDLVIVGPEELLDVMRERIKAAARNL